MGTMTKLPPVQPVDIEPRVRLDGGPFREWLFVQLDRIALECDGAQGALAIRLGISERRLWDWLRKGQGMHLDTIDKALCNFGAPHMLRELYPELYAFPERRRAA